MTMFCRGNSDKYRHAKKVEIHCAKKDNILNNFLFYIGSQQNAREIKDGPINSASNKPIKKFWKFLLCQT